MANRASRIGTFASVVVLLLCSAAVAVAPSQQPRSVGAHSEPPQGVVTESCFGDCDSNGSVTITDLITLVNVALETVPVTACAAPLEDPCDSSIVVDCVVKAVNNALFGCGFMPPTPTPTPAPPNCRAADDCFDQPTGGLCLAPGEFAGCGPTPAPVPTALACDSDVDCAAHGSTFICLPAYTSCWIGSACVPGCVADADCPAAQVCKEDHHCESRPCTSDGDCPDQFSCQQLRCARRVCADDVECKGGYCVKHGCYERFGTCAAPPQ